MQDLGLEFECTALESPPPAPQRKASAKSAQHAASKAAINCLPALVAAAGWGQLDKVQEQTRQIVDLLNEHYPSVSKKLAARLTTNPTRLRPLPDNLLIANEPRHTLTELILADTARREIEAIIHEHTLASKLAAYQLQPRHRILLHGPPGNGKTMVAEAFAGELGLPFLQIKYGGFMDSHLGGTNKNLTTVLEFASQAPCVLFADEFDGLGGARDLQGDVGEARRITNHLLIELERLPSHCLFVAATNMTGIMDRALLRRFDFVIELIKPTQTMVVECVNRELRSGITPGFDLRPQIERISSTTFDSVHSVVELCKQIRRDLVLNQGANITTIVQTLETCPKH